MLTNLICILTRLARTVSGIDVKVVEVDLHFGSTLFTSARSSTHQNCASLMLLLLTSDKALICFEYPCHRISCIHSLTQNLQTLLNILSIRVRNKVLLLSCDEFMQRDVTAD